MKITYHVFDSSFEDTYRYIRANINNSLEQSPLVYLTDTSHLILI